MTNVQTCEVGAELAPPNEVLQQIFENMQHLKR
jgi:hypothetical protein